MIVNAYLNITSKQWEEIKKYVEPNMYHIIDDTKPCKNKCEECRHYCEVTSYEGYCFYNSGLVDFNSTCEDWEAF